MSKSNPIVAALIGLLQGDISSSERTALVNDLTAMKDGAVSGAAAAVPAVEADLGAVVETAADTAITHAVGPFAGIVVPAANALLQRAGGSLVTAISHLLTAAEQFGHSNASAVVTSTIAAGSPAATSAASQADVANVPSAPISNPAQTSVSAAVAAVSPS